ncbi:MAG: ArsC/Spx/MgsR family protein [Pseudomonadota bacterium]
MPKLYGIKNCDTVRKALKAFEAAGKPVEFVDVRAQALTEETVQSWLAYVDAETLINTRGTTWRKMDEVSRGAAMAGPASAILKEPSLFKRPVITDGESVTVGWKAAEQARWLE